MDVGRNYTIRLKILTHFIKGKFSLSPIETILVILSQLESLESLIKLAWKKQDDGLKSFNQSHHLMEGSHTLHKNNINKNHHSKTLHLLIKINNNLVKGLVDTNISMLVMCYYSSEAWHNAYDV